MPSNNAGFWAAKFKRNVARDIAKVEKLSQLGWRIAVVWECSVRSDIEGVVDDLVKWIPSGSSFLEIPESENLPSHHARAVEAGANTKLDQRPPRSS